MLMPQHAKSDELAYIIISPRFTTWKKHDDDGCMHEGNKWTEGRHPKFGDNYQVPHNISKQTAWEVLIQVDWKEQHPHHTTAGWRCKKSCTFGFETNMMVSCITFNAETCYFQNKHILMQQTLLIHKTVQTLYEDVRHTCHILELARSWVQPGYSKYSSACDKLFWASSLQATSTNDECQSMLLRFQHHI